MTKGNGSIKLGESLFNLREDPSESRNLIEENPELAAKMKQRLAELVKAPVAQVSVP
jgi:hypothetical protein